MKMSVFFGCLLLLGSVVQAKPAAESVAVAQDETGRVVVGYSLAGDEPGIVTVGFTLAGQPVDDTCCQFVWGDVNQVVQPGARKIWWDAKRDWPGHVTADGTLKAVVTVWATNAPPMYMDVGLLQKPSDIRYYASAGAVPFGLTADVYKTDRILLRRIYAEGVTWRMGSPTSEAGRESGEAAFLATFSGDYYIGVYPVTQRQYYNFVQTSGISSRFAAWPSNFRAARGYPETDFRPVESISYQKLRGENRNGSAPEYVWPTMGHNVYSDSIIGQFRTLTGLMLDLPTSAQWEYACRAGQAGALNVADAELDELGWYDANSAVDGVVQTHPVGLKKPNAWGLYDMFGNVMEWCLDRYGTYPTAETVPYEDWGGIAAAASENVRVRRGGAYNKPANQCRNAAAVHNYSVECTDADLGFRLCCPAR